MARTATCAPSPSPVTFCQVRSFSKGKDRGGKDKRGKGGKPKVLLKDSEMAAVIPIQEMRDEFAAIVDGLKETYIKTLNVRSGLGIEDLTVEFDGSEHPLKELATITRKTQGNILVLNLTSLPDALKPVLAAITKSGMNLNPQQEGTVIYLQLPRVTREHREILARNAKTLFHKAKEELAKSMNNYVRIANDAKLIGGLSAELVHDTIENIRFLEQEAVAECERHLSTKTKELLGE